VAAGKLASAISHDYIATMSDSSSSIGAPARFVFGFVAGFLATIVCHQLMLALLWATGIASFAPFAMAPTHPFRVPAVISLAFWGGIWGIVFALIEDRFPKGSNYWVTVILFGAILPSLVALMVVLPMKGRPMGGGWHIGLLVTAFLVNGAWGVGTGIFLEAYRRWAKAAGNPLCPR
jgi:hypothetical protein